MRPGSTGHRARKVWRVRILAADRPGAPHRGRGDQDGAIGPGVAQPAPQESPPMSAAAMQRHDQRQGDPGNIGLRHINGVSAACAGLVVEMQDAGVWTGFSLRQAAQQVRFVAAWRVEEVPADRGHSGRQAVERLLGAGQVAQRAIRGTQAIGLIRYRTQLLKRQKDMVTGGGQCCLRASQCPGPQRQQRKMLAKILVRRPACRHDRREILRVQIPGNELQGPQRPQQGRDNCR